MLRYRADCSARSPRLAGAAARLGAVLPPLNFITIHYAYFVVVSLVVSLVFWGSSQPSFSVSYTDSLFLVVSAITESGLNTVNLSQLTTWQQIILFILIVFGGSIWVSIWTVVFRKRVFEQRFDAIVSAGRAHRQQHSCVGGHARPPASPLASPLWHCMAPWLRGPAQDLSGNDSHLVAVSPSDLVLGDCAALPPEMPAGGLSGCETSGRQAPRLVADVPAAGYLRVGGAGAPSAPRDITSADEQLGVVAGDLYDWGASNHLFMRSAGRNSQFHGLTREEREHLGGCEYRALRLLSVLVPLYFFLWQLLGCVAIGAWINSHMASVATSNGINPWWLGVFNGASAFNNSGMTLLDANMIPFERAHFVLVTMGLMILAGNTAYPIFLRLVLWGTLSVLRWTSDDRFLGAKATIEFILQYPRRVYTNLFPARPTWWLLFMVVLLNCIDWVAFELLNLGNPVVGSIPTGSRILDGLFQALAVRSGGFYVVPISEVYIGLQVLYVIMMYISVYPVVITMRHSNVYEERSLGVYSDVSDAAASLDGQSKPEAPVRELARVVYRAFIPWHGVGAAPPTTGGKTPESRISFISQQIRGQLAHDLWWLIIAVLVISTIETSHFLADPVSFSVFNIIFEVVSGYGCVGISTGVPFASYSFSGSWHNASKLVLCLVMIRGRHRGLPVALDRAVLLPGEQLHRDEEEDHRIRHNMANQRSTIDGTAV